MPRGWILGLVTLAAIIAIAVAMGVSVRVGPVVSVCSQDDEIPSAERAEIVRAGQGFMQLIRTGDAAAVRGAMSTDAQRSTQLAAVEQAVQSARVENPGDLSLSETFKLFVPLGSRNATSICGSPSRPAIMARHGGMHSALVTFEEPLAGADRTWTLYLEREAGAWRVRHFHFALSAIAGRDGAAFRELAKGQARAGHTFNATVLYDVAALLLSRGENYQPAEAYGLAQERGALQRHPDIGGNAPFTFHLDDRDFAVSRVNVIGTSEDQSLLLVVDQASEQGVAEPEAIARNRLLIDAMNASRPEWREVFDALVASYPTGGNTIWRTVYSRDEGYLADRAPSAPPPG